MPVPDYQSLMRPLLEAASSKTPDTSIVEIADGIAVTLGLSEDDQAIQIPSGSQSLFYNRLHWAKTYLGKAGLLSSTKRGRFVITARGLERLATTNGPISNSDLDSYAEFAAWRTVRKSPSASSTAAFVPSPKPAGDLSPDDMIAAGVAQLEVALLDDVLTRLKAIHPRRFEAVVVDLLKAMGFGGRPGSESRVTRYSGDGGIDGIIGEDALGLDAVYVQAKRYNSTTVGQPEIAQFVGSMDGEGAHKGVFVTTSTFSKQALAYVEKTTKRIAAIDGYRLAELCLRYGVGVRTRSSFELLALDEEYFEGSE